MSNFLLHVQKLSVETKAAPVKKLVCDASFSVTQGRVTCLVGASGSGKSLSCMAVPGLLPAGLRKSSGEIVFEGQAMNELSTEKLRELRGSRMAMVLQNPASCFDPVFSVRSHFEETFAAHGIRDRRTFEQRMATALEEVGLENPERICRAYPFQLSGGMLQRIMLALALLNNPSLLIADEPTTDLDTVAQKRVLDLIDAARVRRGMGVLLVTHDFGVVARMADEVAVLNEGIVVESKKVREIFESPSHSVTRSLVESHKALSARLDLEKDFPYEGEK